MPYFHRRSSDDLIKGHPGAQHRDTTIYKGRFEGQFNMSLGALTAREYQDERLLQNGAKSAHFCSLMNKDDLRKHAEELKISEYAALAKAMEVKSKEFVEVGAKVYQLV